MTEQVNDQYRDLLIKWRDELHRQDDEIARLRAQRDQLLAALKQLDQMFDFEGGFPSCECFLDPTEVNAVCEMARAAIAKGGEHV